MFSILCPFNFGRGKHSFLKEPGTSNSADGPVLLTILFDIICMKNFWSSFLVPSQLGINCCMRWREELGNCKTQKVVPLAFFPLSSFLFPSSYGGFSPVADLFLARCSLGLEFSILRKLG